MEANADRLRYILGLKLRHFRWKKGYSLKDLSDRADLSISFLSEIEKGKKYPKPEKLMQLAEALEVPFDELVSLKVDKDLQAVTTLLDSPLLKEFPFELFGITPRDLVDLLVTSPSKAGAFVRTFLEIGQSYDMRVEQFLLTALRSYQKMHRNYFEDIEETALSFAKEFQFQTQPPVKLEKLRSILSEEYHYVIEETAFEQRSELRGFRSIFVNGRRPRLVMNEKLLPMQKAFIIGREIGFRHLNLKERPSTSTWTRVESFEQVLNNFKASYFAGAILINQNVLKEDLRKFFQKSQWEGEALLNVMRKYRATPEMFLYRLSQLIPRLFDLDEIYYLRFNNEVGSDDFRLTKELNMSRVSVPHGMGLNEHLCRRWTAITALKELAQKQQDGTGEDTIVTAQKSRFLDSDARFFTITLARPLALSEKTNSSISLGLLMNETFKNTVKFWSDPDVPEVDVNETCERCWLTEAQCSERVAPPYIYEQEQRQKLLEESVNTFMSEMRESA